MPTETEFEEARLRFDTAADETDEVLVPVRQANGPEVLTGGRLTDDVNTFIATTGTELAAVSTELRSLADECARRAEDCRQALEELQTYLADYAAYREADDQYRRQTAGFGAGASSGDPGPRPTPPPKPPPPPPYVDLGSGVEFAQAAFIG